MGNENSAEGRQHFREREERNRNNLLIRDNPSINYRENMCRAGSRMRVLDDRGVSAGDSVRRGGIINCNDRERGGSSENNAKRKMNDPTSSRYLMDESNFDSFLNE